MSAWSSGAVGAAVVAGVAAIIATVWIGSHVREETVVANPYEEGLRLAGDAPGARQVEPACDLSSRACTQRLAQEGEVTLEMAPRPLRTMTELRVRAVVRAPASAGGSDAVVVAFSMVGMDMGKNEVRLARADGAWTGTAILVRCPSGRKDWIAEVRLGGAAGAVRAVRFPFTVED